MCQIGWRERKGEMDAMAGKMADGELSAMGGSLMSCSEEAILVLWRQFTEWSRWVLRLCWSTACPVGLAGGFRGVVCVDGVLLWTAERYDLLVWLLVACSIARKAG